MKLKEWMESWLENYVRVSVKKRTYLHYRRIYENHVLSELGEYLLEELSLQVLQAFIFKKARCGNLVSGKSLSANSVIAMVSLIKRALMQAAAAGEMKMIDFSLLKMPAVREKEVSAFEIKEQRIIERYCLKKGGRYVGILLCLYTGIRLGELLALRWSDISFEKRLMRINKAVSRVGNENVVDVPKTKSSMRIIPLSVQIIKVLRYAKLRSSSEYVVSTREGGMVLHRCYQRSFRAMLKRCRVPYRNFHALRHTFATRAIEQGVDAKTVSEILGHKNVSITLNRYSHSLMSHKAEMMNKIGSMLE